MGKKNRERRAAKAKQRTQARARHLHRRGPDPSQPLFTGRERVAVLLDAAVSARLRNDAPSATELVDALTRFDEQVVLHEVAGELRRILPGLWDAGWQPPELVRQARRDSARAGRLVAAAVLADHAGRRAATFDPRWASQVDDLAAGDESAQAAAAGDWLTAFAARETLHGEALTTVLVDGLTVCLGVGPLAILIPPPGTSPSTSPGAADRAHGPPQGDDKVLARVRALLVQAESTTFEAEAMTFTAKAHELMARHAIDVAMVWARDGRDERPVTVRLPIDDPYADVKSFLLQLVAEHARCRSIFHPRYALSTVVGYASDVSATEMLFTSLLVQSQMAMQAEAAAAGPGNRVRSRSFRSSFLLAYAHRIDERLTEVNRAVESEVDENQEGSLLPVLRAREDSVDEVVDELFGELRAGPVRAGRDSAGWVRGRLAADRAQLTFGDITRQHEGHDAPQPGHTSLRC